MKNKLKLLELAVIAASCFMWMSITSCDNGLTNNDTSANVASGPSIISIAAIAGVTAPVNGGIPVTVITENAQYGGTVVWTPSDETFQPNKVYYAVITLTEKGKYTLQGVQKNFFTVAGALTVTNDENSGVITAVFPRTAGTVDNPAVIDIKNIEGVTVPIIGGIPKSEISPSPQYTGTITWSPKDNPYEAGTVYTATITLEPKIGFTFKGVATDFFTVKEATTANAANSNVVTAVFRVTSTIINNINELSTFLSAQSANTKTTPYYIVLNVDDNNIYSYSNYSNYNLGTTLNNAPDKYVYFFLSGSTITEIPSGFFSGCTSLTGVTILDSFTNIGESAFSGCTSLANVTIPDSVTSIAYGAFASCTSLTDITIPDSVTSIGGGGYYYGAFSGCTSLASITIPDSVTSIGEWAFYGCTNLANVTIGNGVTSIGNGAFLSCTSLANVTIGNGVTSIGNGAFLGCTSLASITIPDSVTNIGSSTFSGCTSLASITVDSGNLYYASEDGILYNKEKTEFICIPRKISGDITIPDSITSIGFYKFYGYTSLANVTIGNGVTSIGESAFSGCTSLASITIPDSVGYIGQYAFSGCTSLTNVTIPDSVTSIEYWTFDGCTSLTGVTIGNGVTSIGGFAFSGCTSLASITIPDSVTSIGYSAFNGCTSLTSVTIPDSVTSIGYYAFSGCTSLASITIPDSVTDIGYWAFSGCTSLASITIPDSVTHIWDGAFSGCTRLAAINVGTANSAYTSENGVLYDKNKQTLIQYPAAKSGASFTIPDSVRYIGKYAFSDFTSPSITIPDTVWGIGYGAFSGCTGLTSVTFQGTISSSELGRSGYNDFDIGNENIGDENIGDLREKYLAGGIGTYTRQSGSKTWTKQ
jgi:hypothetical protein